MYIDFSIFLYYIFCFNEFELNTTHSHYKEQCNICFTFCTKTSLWYFQMNLSTFHSHCLKLHITLQISKYANINQELQMYLRIWYPISSMSWSREHHSTWHEAAADDSRGYICGGMIISFAVLLILICIIYQKTSINYNIKIYYEISSQFLNNT